MGQECLVDCCVQNELKVKRLDMCMDFGDYQMEVLMADLDTKQYLPKLYKGASSYP